jgi:hypothetical protein
MNPDDKQSSVNRPVSKKQILTTSVLAGTLALVFGTGEAQAASSAFAATSAGTSEATLDSHSASGTFTANSPDSHYAIDIGSFALTNFARASVVGPGISVFTSASFSGDPVIQSRATASGEWKDTVFFSLDWTLYPDVTGLNPHAIIQISANITAVGAAGVGATATLNFTDLSREVQNLRNCRSKI